MKQLTQAEIDKIKSNFDYFDRDSNGMLDEHEFRSLFKALAPDSKQAEADEGFAAIDQDKSGSIEFEEFLDWWQSNWFVY